MAQARRGAFGCVKVELAQCLCQKVFGVAKELEDELLELWQEIRAMPQFINDRRKHFLVPIHRKMSLASFLDLIDHMRACKDHADCACKDIGSLAGLVHETFSYLREQYGLKYLVVEAALCIFRAARNYGGVSTEVAALSIFAGAAELPGTP